MISKRYLLFLSVVFFIGIAIGILLTLKEKESNKPEILFKNGKKLLSQGKYEDAILVFKVLNSTYPSSTLVPYSLYEIGKIQEYYFKNEKEAVNTYKKVMKYNRSVLNKICLKKINIYKSSGHSIYKDIVRKFPKFTEIKYSQKDLKGLPSDIELIIYDFPGFYRHYFLSMLGKIHKENKNYSDSIKIFQQLIKETKNREDILKYWLEISDSYYKSGKYSLSLKCLTENYSPSDYNPVIQEALGDIMFSLKKYKEALDFYIHIPSYPPFDKYFIQEEIEIKIARTYDKLGEKERAISTLKTFLENYDLLYEKVSADRIYHIKRTNRARYLLGKLYQKTRNIKEAISSYQKVKLLPQAFDDEEVQPQTLLELSNIYIIQGKLHEALLALRSIPELYPKTTYLPEAKLSILLCLEKRGAKVKKEEYENILNTARRADILIKAYYRLINIVQDELYKAGLPFYTLLEEEYNIAQKYGEKIISAIETERKENNREDMYNLVASDIYSFLLDFEKVQYEQQLILSSSDIKTIETKTYKGENAAEYLEYLRGKKTLYYEIKKISNKKDKSASDLVNLANLYQNLGLFYKRDELYREAKIKDKKYVEKLYRIKKSEFIEQICKINEKIVKILNSVDGKHISYEILNLYEEEIKNILANLIVGLGDYINPKIYTADRKINWEKKHLNLELLIPPDAIWKKQHIYLTERIGEIYLALLDFKNTQDKTSTTQLLNEIENFNRIKQSYE